MDKAKLFDVLHLLLQCKVSRKPREQELHVGFGWRVLPLVVGVIAYSFEAWAWEIYLREHGALKPLPRLKRDSAPTRPRTFTFWTKCNGSPGARRA